MRPIPPKMTAELEKMPRMSRCTLWQLTDLYGPCRGRVEWHHVWTYAGRQINELWAILAACHYHHGMVNRDPAIKQAFEAASFMLATDEDLEKYPRKGWQQIKKSLGIV